MASSFASRLVILLYYGTTNNNSRAFGLSGKISRILTKIERPRLNPPIIGGGGIIYDS
jgi:hypothetical protein